jgi:hypothetical protein
MWEHLKQFGQKVGCEEEKTNVMSPVIQRDAMKRHTENGGTVPCILNLSSR